MFRQERLAAGKVASVTIADGRNQYLIVIAPTEQMHLVTSNPGINSTATSTVRTPMEPSISN